MAKWRVVERLYFPSTNQYAEPGEVIELTDEAARVLVMNDLIKPAVLPTKKGVRKDDTNNRSN